ncbi:MULTISPECIES: hypothetical protein [Bacillus]|uniref:hypothetical protein n=1 Tax=Bacillus TaxID=1386 RepID=UPI00356B6B14
MGGQCGRRCFHSVWQYDPRHPFTAVRNCLRTGFFIFFKNRADVYLKYKRE